MLMSSDENKTVLIVYPHADDGELGAGLTASILLSKGYDIVNACMVPGNTRRRGGVADEWKIAAKRMGYTKNHMFNFPDCYLPAHVDDMVTELENLRKEYDPFLVIYSSGKDTLIDSHQDHRALYAAARIAFRGVPLQWGMMLPSTHLGHFNPTEFQSTKNTICAYMKANALLAYGSQSDIASGTAALSALVSYGRNLYTKQTTCTLEDVLSGSHSQLLETLVDWDPLEINQGGYNGDLRMFYAGNLMGHLPGTVFAEPFEPIQTSTPL